jgi:hypothetical protein
MKRLHVALILLILSAFIGFGCVPVFEEIPLDGHINLSQPPDNYDTCQKSVTFIWESIANAHSYELAVCSEASCDSPEKWVIVDEVDANDPLEITPVPPLEFSNLASHNIPYKWKILAKNNFQYKSSQVRQLIIRDCDQPEIILLAPTSGQIIYGEYNVTANALDNWGISKVNLKIDDGEFITFTQNGGIDYEISGYDLVTGEHTITLVAYDYAGQTTEIISTFVVGIMEPLPIAPGNNCGTGSCPPDPSKYNTNTYVCDSNFPRLDWDDAMGATNYEIEVFSSGDTEDYSQAALFYTESNITDVNWKASEANGTGVEFPNGCYYWRVRGVNNVGSTSEWSDIYFFMVNKLVGPTLSFPAQGVETANTLTDFQWEIVPNATSYDIQISRAVNEETQELSLAGSHLHTNRNINSAPDEFNRIIFTPNEPLVVDPVLKLAGEPTPYYWRVRAKTESCAGPWSDIRDFKLASILQPTITAPDPCGVPYCSPPAFEWDMVPGADNYMYQLANPPSSVATYAGDNVIFQDNYTRKKNNAGMELGPMDVPEWPDYAGYDPCSGNECYGDQGFMIASDATVCDSGGTDKCWYDPVDQYLTQMALPHNGRLPSGRYFFRVRASDGEFFTDWSDTCYFEIKNGVDVPLTLTGPEDVSTPRMAKECAQPTFTWDNVTGPTGYQFVLMPAGLPPTDWDHNNPPAAIIDEVINGAGASSYTPSSYGITIPPGTYEWNVRPINPPCYAEWSGFPTVQHFTLTMAQIAGTPDLYEPDPSAPNYYICAQNPTFEWEDLGAHVTNYKIQISDNDPSFASNLGTFPTPDTTYTYDVTDLTARPAGQFYYWRVMATNDIVCDGCGTQKCSAVWSTPKQFDVDQIPDYMTDTDFSPTGGASVCSSGAVDITFEWPHIPEADEYAIQVSTDSTNWLGTVYTTFEGINCTVGICSTVEPFNDNNTYYWRVRGTGSNCGAEWSNMNPAHAYGEFNVAVIQKPTHKDSDGAGACDSTPGDNELVTGDQATLEWRISTGSKHDNVEIHISTLNDANTDACAGCVETDSTLSTVGAPNYSYTTDSGLVIPDGTTYYWAVRGIQNPGTCKGEWSDVRTFRLLNLTTVTPSTPGTAACPENDPNVNTPSGTYFSWTPTTGTATHYAMEIWNNSNCTAYTTHCPTCGTCTDGGPYSVYYTVWPRVNMNAGNRGSHLSAPNTWITTTFGAGNTYYWRVKPYYDDTSSTYCGSKSGTIHNGTWMAWRDLLMRDSPKPNLSQPRKEDNVKWENVPLCLNPADMVWANAAATNGFTFELFTNGAFSTASTWDPTGAGIWGGLPIENGTGTSYSYGGVQPGYWYGWRVKGESAQCTSNWREGWFHYIPLDQPGASGADLTATVVGTDVTLAWPAVDNATSYELQVADGAYNPSTKICYQNANVTSTSIVLSEATLTAGNCFGKTDVYIWRVGAKNKGSEVPAQPCTSGYRPSDNDFDF